MLRVAKICSPIIEERYDSIVSKLKSRGEWTTNLLMARIGGPILPPNLPTNHPNNCIQYSLCKPYKFVTICVQTCTPHWTPGLQCRTAHLPRQQQVITTILPLEIPLMGPLQPLHQFIKSPVRPIKRPPSPSTYLQSPVKRRTTPDIDRFIAPPPRFDQSPPPPNFITPNNTAIRVKRRFRKFVRSKKLQKSSEQNDATRLPALQDEEFDFTDSGGFEGFGSPVKAHDCIDWSITTYDLEKLKLEILPSYWEHLLDSVNSIVRVTQRLYILQDWNYKGHLVVKSNCIQLIDRLNSIGISTEWLTSTGLWVHPAIVKSRQPVRAAYTSI